MRIGVLGTGTIASAVVRGIAGDGHEITVSTRGAAQSAALAAAFDNVAVADNQAVLDQSDVIFLGLMAGAAEAVLGGLAFRADQQVISFMAGAPLARVQALVSPAQARAIMMPFPGIAQGGSAVIAQGETALIEEVFGHNNNVFEVKDNAELEAYLCAQAVLSPVARMVEEAALWLGSRVADADQGEAFLRQLVASSLGASACAPLLAALNTPGGFNQRLRRHMDDSGSGAALRAGLDSLERDG
ncbi:NAD(P)-binding domain-containing protein [Shimia sp.]|uniref:NAD(P)-binding domain-containing protein n=1 Tax=Shimia sp. TaxID=1954381 RepID=UPI00356AD859